MKLSLKPLFFVTFLIFNSFGNILINEFMASNATVVLDYDYVNYADWVELYNPTSQDIDIGGYYLSDNLNQLDKWQIPENTVLKPNSYYVIWTDGNDSSNHTSFKLKIAGESIVLSDQSLKVIDSITFDLQWTDVSYGRISSDQSKWAFFGIPTPKSENSLHYTLSTSMISPSPLFSQSGGLFKGIQTIALSSSNENCTIRYTLNGSVPTEKSTLYTTPISISQNTVVRARAFLKDHLPSKTVTNSYLIDEDIKLPVISLVMDSMDLWDDHIGMYTIGTNGKKMYGVTANYHHDWRRASNIELFENDGTQRSFNIPCGIAVAGERRNMLQKTWKVYIKNSYGIGELEYQLFPDKPINIFTSFFIRNSGYSDFRYTMMRDGIIHSLVGNSVMDIDMQSYKPVVMFINGNYWGIHNIRERVNADYLATNHGVDPGNLDILEFEKDVISGDDSDWLDFIDNISDDNLNEDDFFDYVNKTVDLEEWYNYIITEFFFANNDWPGNNNKRWKEKNSLGKWRWLLIDMDAGFNNWGAHDFNMVKFALEKDSDNWSNPPWSTLIHWKFLENNKIKNNFLQKYAAYLNTIFSKERIHHFIDSIQTTLEPDMPRQIEKWGKNCEPNDTDSKDGCVMKSMDFWYQNVDRLREFANKREEYVIKHLIDFFKLDGLCNLTLNFNKNNSGKIFINDILISDTTASVKLFKNLPVKIKAIPNPGYWFNKNISPFSGNDSTTIILTNDSLINITFSVNNQTEIKGNIKSNLTLTKENSPYLINSSIIIDSFSTLTINPGVEILMNKGASIITHGNIKALGTAEEVITINPNYNSGISSWGSIFLYNSTDTSIFKHTTIYDGSKDPIASQAKASLSSLNSNLKIEHCKISGKNQPVHVEYGSLEAKNSFFECNSTCDMINVKYGAAYIDNCRFKGNQSVDTDAIDYDQIKKGVIKNCVIYDFKGGNSDGIDLGEQCDSVLVESNFINNCTDKGISVGQASTVLLYNNIITNCTMGIGIKDSFSYAYISDNTIYNIDTGVACFEKNLGAGGGRAEVVNTIFSNCQSKDFYVDTFSSIDIAYSLSDRSYLKGSNNLFNDPFFKSPVKMDFSLRSNSPCIGKGDSLSYFNRNRKSVDIGADYIQYSIDSLYTNLPFKPQHLPSIVSINPNPIQNFGIFHIPIINNSINEIFLTIYNSRGQLIKKINEKNLSKGIKILKVNLESLSSGIYFYSIFGKETKYTGKFIIAK